MFQPEEGRLSELRAEERKWRIDPRAEFDESYTQKKGHIASIKAEFRNFAHKRNAIASIAKEGRACSY